MEKTKPMFSKCMLCGRVRRKGDAEWLPSSVIKESAVVLSHGYCPGCREIKANEMLAEIERIEEKEIITQCAYCGSIQTDEDTNTWDGIEREIIRREPYTHGACPTCFEIERQKIENL